MGIIKAIVTLVNAFPALAKFLERINSAIKEKNARENYDRKVDAIDAAIHSANSRVSAHSIEWGGSDAEASAVSGGGKGSTSIHKGGNEEAGAV